jgi:low affinity Fe/Cu permease
LPEADVDSRKNEIKDLIGRFCTKHLNNEYAGYAFSLLDRITSEPTHSITRGKKEIWAAAIIYVIARLNFLFDKESEFFLQVDTIRDFFGTKKTTIANKATAIETFFRIMTGDQDLYRRDITDMLTFVEAPDGFIRSKSAAERMEVVVEFVDGEEAEEINRWAEEQAHAGDERAREKRETRAQINREIAKKKRMERNKNQFKLFGDDDE